MAVDPGELDAVCAWLAAGADTGDGPAKLIETHAARVFLIGDIAYKVKKPVDLGYLDFSTPARRQTAIRRELEFNRATAPDVYLAVRQVTRAAGGALEFDGPGPALEAVLKMRRFDPEAVLSGRPEAVRGDFAEDLGRRIAAFHKVAAARPAGGGAAAMGFVIDSNAGHLRQLPGLKGPLAEALIARTEAALEALAPLLEARRAAGLARRCHGDLHLGNIAVEHGRPLLFDCIEFNDALADIDVLYDLAFLIMDLTFRGERHGAVRVLGGYADEAARWAGEAALSGLAALPFFLSVRAAVRAHVSAQMGDDALARAYRQAALDHLSPPPPTLAAVGGLSGSGKSTVARALAPRLGAPPGALILRSDEIRKRLWAHGPKDRLPAQAYGPGQSERVYGAMLREADAALTAGWSVVLDAVFLKPAERAAAEALAAAHGVIFCGAWLDATPETLTARVSARSGDASDAGPQVVQAQLVQGPGAVSWLRLDARQDAEAIVAQMTS